MSAPVTEDLLRSLAPQVLGALVRRYGHFDAAEEAVQDALLAAAQQWPRNGRPTEPRTWLVRVASRRLIDQLRSERSRREREDPQWDRVPLVDRVAAGADESSRLADDSLLLLILCCYPELSAEAQVALTLRAVGGLTTAEIARAFMVPETTMGQRISRAKQRIGRAAVFSASDPSSYGDRLDAVRQVLYLVFTEGRTRTAGPEPHAVGLAEEAIRLARLLVRVSVDDPESEGLLAMMLLSPARRDSRLSPGGELVPLLEQDRSGWDRAAVVEGTALITAGMSRPPLGPFQVQAAIAALHVEAPSAADTDWLQILTLYGLLETMTDNPVVTLNRAVAAAMVRGPHAGLRLLDPLTDDRRLSAQHGVDVVRAHLLELVGDTDGAVAAYRRACDRTGSAPERHYLRRRLAGLAVES